MGNNQGEYLIKIKRNPDREQLWRFIRDVVILRKKISIIFVESEKTPAELLSLCNFSVEQV